MQLKNEYGIGVKIYKIKTVLPVMIPIATRQLLRSRDVLHYPTSAHPYTGSEDVQVMTVFLDHGCDLLAWQLNCSHEPTSVPKSLPGKAYEILLK